MQMKSFKNVVPLASEFIALTSLLVVNSIRAQESEPAPFLEANGLVVMEVESIPTGETWSFENSIPGFSGSGYVVGTHDSFNRGGNGLMRFPVYISQSGRYQLAWKSRITEGNSNTDSNDSFARITNASGTPLDTVPNENVKIGEWYKVYMNRSNEWSYDARNKDHDPHSLSWNLEADTLYYFELSSRSKGHGVDRVVLWDRNVHAFANLVTGTASSFSALDDLSESSRLVANDKDEDGDSLPDDWEARFGGPDENIDPESDDDGDGRDARLEFAMGTDPMVPETAYMLALLQDDGFMWANVEYTWSDNASPYFDLMVERSSNLVDWTDSGLSEDLFLQDLGENRRLANARIRVGPQAPLQFFRLRAVERD